MDSTNKASVVVVGAGSLGVATAFHLLQAGVKDVVLVDKDLPGYGTSNAGAGYVGPIAAGWAEGWGAVELEVEQYGIDFLSDLATETSIGFRRNGHLYIARNADAWNQLEGFFESDMVPDREIVDPSGITELTRGFVKGDAFYQGVLQPSAIQVSAGAAVRALAERYAAQGGAIQSGRPVTGLIVENRQVRGVDTTKGPIRADKVVVAAGAWTNALVGPHHFVPQVPLLLHRTITAPCGAPPEMPAMNLAGYSADGRGILWVREDNGGLNWGMGSAPGYPRDMFVNEPVPERYDQVPLDGVMQARRQAVAVSDAIPGILGDSFSVASGALCMTPDHRALIGDVDALPGLFLVAGCNGVGVQHGPGWGKVAADLITAGASTIDGVEAWNPNRFDRSYTSVAEVYGDLTPLRRPVSHA